MLLRPLVSVLALAICAAISWPGAAQTSAIPASIEESPILLKADRIDYDRNADIVTASGKVEVAQGERLMFADSLSYNRVTNVVTADGNIVLMEPSGEVFFADYVELTDDLKAGVIEQIRILLTDDSRVAAASAKRVDGNTTIMRKAVFSPCKLCEKDPSRAPLWQLKATEVTHDQQRQQIEYKDAFLELWGIPVLYTPYLAHSDPTVKRQSGFLAPSFGNDEELGFVTQIPYYWVISEDQDLTFQPIIMTENPPVPYVEYRRRFSFGEILTEGSIGILDRSSGGKNEKDKLRGHARFQGEFNIDENWRTKADLYRASDDTYLSTLGIDGRDTLRSQVHLEGFHGRSYTSALGFAVQDLRENVDDEDTPTVLPELGHQFVSEPYSFGGYWTVDANARAIHRLDDARSRNVSVKGAFNLPHTTASGHVFDFSASLRGDVYNVENVRNGGNEEHGFVGRVVPRLTADWRYPLVRPVADSHLLIEPRVVATATLNGGNSDRIPDEDSFAVEFDQTNIFRENRFAGLDRVDDGQRISYGLKLGALLPKGREITGFIGQTFRNGSDSTFSVGSGLDGDFSDIVGGLNINPASYLDLLYRFRMDRNDLELKSSELAFRIGPKELSFSGNYAKLDLLGDATQTFEEREQIDATLSSKFTDNWSVFVGHQRDLNTNKSLRNRAGLTYSDECLTFQATFVRDFTSDAEVGSNDSIFFRVVFKNVGEFQSGQ